MSRTFRRPWAPILVGVLGLPWRATAAEDGSMASRLREAMQSFVDKKEISGAVVLVGDPDKVLALEAVGRRDIEGDLPMRPDTIFRIASMTKPITAIGVMILADEGKLSVSDPVEKYLPTFRGQQMVASREGDTLTRKPSPRPITIHDLLTHTSGLPDSIPPDRKDLASRRDRTLAEAAEGYAQRPLSFEPGTKWSYSNSGITTLGRIIEVVSGQPYQDFLKARIFDPLGMADTTFYPTPDQMSRLAVTYERKDGELRPVAASTVTPTPETRLPGPAGGLYSTASDLARLYQMMLLGGALGGHRIFSETAVKEMTRLQTGEIKTGFTDGMGYGLGWGFVRKPSGVTERLSPGTFGHGGAWGTQGWIDPKVKRFGVLLIQRTGLPNSDASDVRRAFQAVAFDADRAPEGPNGK